MFSFAFFSPFKLFHFRNIMFIIDLNNKDDI